MYWRVYGYLVAAVVAITVAYPATWPSSRDSFPLSGYPMFSRPKPDPTITEVYAVGVAADATRTPIPPELLANDEVLQARAVLRRAVRAGRSARRELCKSIAERVDQLARDKVAEWMPIVEIRIVSGTHNAVDYLTGADPVGKERTRIRCSVPGHSNVKVPRRK
ncbi:MAG: hypothetical protein AAGC55_34370 [Myxococcota bacterium]